MRPARPLARRHLRLLLPLVPALLAPACSGATPPSPAPPPAAPPPAPFPLPLPNTAQGTLTPVKDRAQVPLTGPRVDAKPGDYLLQHQGHAAVVSAEGKIIDFGDTGGRDELVALDPTVYLGLGGAHAEVARIGPLAPGSAALYVERRVFEKPITLHTLVYFEGTSLHIESAVSAASAEAASLSITLGERVFWGNVPTWVEGHGFIESGGTYPSDFIARESLGRAYALCSPQGRLQARFGYGPLSGFYPSASTGEQTIPVPAQGLSHHRVINLATAQGSLGRAAMALPCFSKSGSRPLLPPRLPARARIEAARCPDDKHSWPRPFARFSAEDGTAALPSGCFQMRLVAPGHAPSPWFSPSAIAAQTLPPTGTLRFSVTERGKGLVPARVLVRGISPTPDPDWGDDPDEGAALNVVYTDKGEGSRPLPPGRYHVIIGRGFEYTAHEQDITVGSGAAVSVTAELERVVDTRGWVAADLHLHAAPSSDAPQPLADRVRALVATGVEVGVATDHNKVTDYRPTIEAMGLRDHIASMVGDEVTADPSNFGHFNVFPLEPSAEPITYKGTTPARIFAEARARGPLGKDTIVQVNHPRMGDIGYFDLLHLDRDDLTGSLERAPLADMSFSAIEIFNGDHYASIAQVEACMKDWYGLLDAGYAVTATGNSDSHKLAFHEAGVPRNLVALPNDDPKGFDERAFVEAIRKGRVTVSSGPFVTLEAAGQGIGATIAPGTVEITVRVDAPPWVDVAEVELVRRGAVIERWSEPFAQSGARFEARTQKPLAKGDWIIAIARGKKPMSYLHRPGALPFGFTNPIWVK